MNTREKILSILRGHDADVIPFVPYDNLIPRGNFERDLRNRGMGLLKRVDEIWESIPGLRQEHTVHGDEFHISYHTPVGSVSAQWKGHVGRIDDRGEVQTAWMIKRKEDFAPVFYMLDNCQFHADYAAILDNARDLGEDGLVRGTGLWPPYDTLEYYFGLVNWSYAQVDYPDLVEQLYEKLCEKEARRAPYVLNSPAEYVSFGSLSGSYSPRQFKRYTLPFYEKYIPLLRQRGKICALHAHNSNLNAFKDMLHDTDVQVIEAYTPPPLSDCPIQEARKSWGKDTVIWVNFPETIFWSGVKETYQYTLNLLKSDPCPERLIIGMTEMGMYGVTDTETERCFKDGIIAIMDAIDAFSGRR
jgi:hypothetical protein